MKKRTGQRDPQRQVYWEQVMRRWQEGGRSVTDFCRAEGVRESAFYFWRRELARRNQQAVKGPRPKARQAASASRSPRPSQRSRPVSPPPSFLPVRVVKDGVAEAPHTIDIVLGQGRMVRVQSGFDRQTLVDVLAVLECRPC